MHISEKKPAPIPPMLIYHPDGTIEARSLTHALSLAEYQHLVDGSLELIDTDDLYHYFANEEGLLHHLPPNQTPKIIELGLRKYHQQIVGTVIAVPKQLSR